MENTELAAYLDSLEREDSYRVEEVLKESPFEVTQRVSFVGENGAAQGPFIRKFIAREAGLGSVYERLFEAQREGRRFKYLPVVLECYTRGDKLVVVMECAIGETLQDLVYRVDPSVTLARDVFPRLCNAVSELHEAFDPPIIHRDLKPSNVVLAQGGCTIIDFGIAREYKDGADADTRHFGTRAFAPPEQFGFGQTTVRSDVYALGMLLYFCLTEEIPKARERADWCDDRRIPRALRGVIEKATAFDPQQRYASASEMKAAFLGAVESTSDAARLKGSAQPAGARDDSMRPEEAADGGRGETPSVVGRVWNGVVIVAFLALALFFLGWTAYTIFVDQSRLDVAPWRAVIRAVLGEAFLTAFAFACLDKRRIRRRIPALAGVRAWQAWAVAGIAYAIATFFNSLA